MFSTILFHYLIIHYLPYLLTHYTPTISSLPLLSFIIHHRIPLFLLSHTSFSNIAFIMDGNRRYAKKANLTDSESKTLGFKKMIEIAHFCRKIGIKEVSFYALSKNNILKRSKEELECITQLIKNGRKNLTDQNMRIKVYGQPELLNGDVKEYFQELENNTRNHDFVVNIFFGYSSRDEIKNKRGYKKRVEVLIRTSGERRLSDFLLEEVSDGCNIVFCRWYWPELSVRLLSAILMKCEREKEMYY